MTSTAMTLGRNDEVGQSIPPNTAHAVSVSLPSWKANVGYEEGEDWVLSKMKTGYPRFFVHKSIDEFAAVIIQKYGLPQDKSFLFPSHAAAQRCSSFLQVGVPDAEQLALSIVDLYIGVQATEMNENALALAAKPIVSAVIFPNGFTKIAKVFWQHTGEGISSRRAEYCHKAILEGHLHAQASSNEDKTHLKRPASYKGPRRYQKNTIDISPTKSANLPNGHDGKDHVQFVEERFGRNLDASLSANAKLAIKRRIAGVLTANVDLREALEMDLPPARTMQAEGFSENDVYLYPNGMNSIFNTHRIMMACRGQMKSISFGFPYIDTLKILEKWGPGCLFYGHGADNDLDDLEQRCERGEKYLALFCEFPGNPLLKTPNLRRIRALADRYDFAVVVDETIGNFVNVHVLPCADVVVSSLTKVFTGECNVMGGSAVLNPQGCYYTRLKELMKVEYEDNYWPEDAIFMERNSRDFVSRVARINTNAEAICETLKGSPIVKEVYYPKNSATREFYDDCRNKNGGYGGLLSVTFQTTAQAVRFFDGLETAKGPSLGTNFTLSSPYVILAHYNELEWTAQFGVDPDLVRVSIGLEDTVELVALFEKALAKTLRSLR